MGGKNRAYYEEIYDTATIWLCRTEEEILAHVYKDGLMSKVNKLEGDAKEKAHESLLRSIGFMHYFRVEVLAGERWEGREQAISRMVAEDGARNERVASARLRKEPTCSRCAKCNLRILSKDLLHKPDEDRECVVFMVECMSCKKRSGVWEDGSLFVSRKSNCPKCKTVMSYKTEQVPGAIVSKFVCHACGYCQQDRLELRPKNTEADPNWEEDRQRFVLSDAEGQKFLEERQNLAGMKRLVDSFKQQEKPTDPQIPKPKQATVVQLKEILRKPIEDAGFIELTFERPEMGRYVIMGFSCLDGKAGRSDYESRNTLKKTISASLNGTNWSLMSEGISYRLGYLSGRLRASER